MIIKSLSRATKSFEALYTYLTIDKNSKLNTYNLYSNPYNKKEVINEFLQNAQYLKNARGKNYLYHEIISLNQNNLNLDKQTNILIDLVNKYILLRCENHLTFTAIHKDKDHLHIHLMISSNELMASKRRRLSKKEFSTIQKELEQYINDIYPQLGKTKHYNKDYEKLETKKEFLKSSLKDLFKNSTSKEDFKTKCNNLNIEFYTRGQTIGIIFNNKKHRLKTLEVLEDYENLINKLDNNKNQEYQNLNNNKKDDLKQNKTTINQRRKKMNEIRQQQNKDLKIQEKQ